MAEHARPAVSMPPSLLAAIDHAVREEGFGPQGRSLLIRLAITAWLKRNSYPTEISPETGRKAS